jgi:hypothetical protein
MTHEQCRTHPRTARGTRPWARVRRFAIIGAAAVCLAAGGLRSDTAPQSSWLTDWIAPVAGTVQLATAIEPLEAMSEASIDLASLLVLGLSLIGGGHLLRRQYRWPARHAEAPGRVMPSRAPVAAAEIGPRRLAR